MERYELTYREESEEEGMTRVVAPAASLDETISGLKECTRYVITITPFNSAGAGAVYTSPVIETPKLPTPTPTPTPPGDCKQKEGVGERGVGERREGKVGTGE